MTPEMALRLGRAITFVAGRGKDRQVRIVIGKDTRLSGYCSRRRWRPESVRWAGV